MYRSPRGSFGKEADAVSAVTAYAAQAAHFILPVIALIVLIRCIASMFYGRAEPGDLGSSRHAGRQGLSPAALGVPDRPRPQRRHHAALSRRGQRPRRAHAQRRRRVDRQRPEPQRRRVPQRRTDHRADAGVQRRHSPLLDAHAQVRRHERRAPRRAGAAPHDRRTEGLRRRHAVFPDGVSAAAGAGVRVLGRQRAPGWAF